MPLRERRTYSQLGSIPVTDVDSGFACQYTYDTDNRIKKVAYNIPGVDNTFASYYYSSDESSTDVAVGALTKMSMFSKGWINYMLITPLTQLAPNLLEI